MLAVCKASVRVALILVVVRVVAHGSESQVLPLDRGYRHLYDLNFALAEQEFDAWEQQNPTDPIGPASKGAGLLFSEFHRLGVLETQFYENDRVFDSRKKFSPDPELKARFDKVLTRADQLSQRRLAQNANDRDALFALTLAAGLRADYAALIEKRNFASLRYTREATGWARRLLAIDPTCYDARLATGISQYIIGSMAAPVRWFLRIGGVPADKAAGIADLRVAAEKGRYLAPFARILLAIAYVRDHDRPQARAMLAGLHQEFPNNPLFAREIARLDAMP